MELCVLRMKGTKELQDFGWNYIMNIQKFSMNVIMCFKSEECKRMEENQL